MPRNYLVILGGGKSVRFGSDKLNTKLLGKPVLDILFSNIPWNLFDDIVWVGDKEKVPSRYRSHILVAPAGDTRFHSVKNGVSYIDIAEDDKVIIHDAARFLVTSDLFLRVLAYLDKCDVVYPSLPAVDALRIHTDHEVRTISRENVYRVQTPQGFRGKVFHKILNFNEHLLYDEVMIAEKLGFSICKVDGDITNIKLTYSDDIVSIEKFIQRFSKPLGIGIGFDSHVVEAGGFLYVGGVKVSDEFHSVGWSDGDALLHAIIDAILGAHSVYADVGTLFPPGDMRYKNIRSTDLVRDVIGRYGSVHSISSIVILGKVKLKDYRNDIVSMIKELTLAKNVSISFKTPEGLSDNLYMAYAIVTV